MTVYYTKDHEWVSIEGDSGTVGITDYAQSQLGDITFVELPAPGSTVKQGDGVSVIDSVKAASDVYAPVSGEVVATNERLESEPELVNAEAEADGWLYRVTLADSNELSALMDRAAYDAYIAGL